MRRTHLAIILALTALACNMPAFQQSASQTSVPAQPTGGQPVVPETAVELSPEPTGGTISGKVCYPGGGIPEMEIFVQDVNSGAVISIEQPMNTDHYLIDGLPAGTYIAFAYPVDTTYNVSGGYTQMVPCGLTASCTDHTLIEVTVDAGTAVTDADICDWYAPEGPFPSRP